MREGSEGGRKVESTEVHLRLPIALGEGFSERVTATVDASPPPAVPI